MEKDGRERSGMSIVDMEEGRFVFVFCFMWEERPITVKVDEATETDTHCMALRSSHVA